MSGKAVAQILLLSAIWGVSFLLIRVAGQSFPPFWIALLRSGLGAVLLLAVLLARRQPLPERRYLPALLLVAAFQCAIPFVCFAWGERYVPSNTAAVLNALTPIFTLLIGMGRERRMPRMQVVCGVLLGFAGVVLVVLGQAGSSAADVPRRVFLLGVVLVACGALSYGVAATIAKAKLQGVAPMGIAASQLGLAALLVLPMAAVGPHPAQVHAAQAVAIAVLGFAGSGVAYLLFFHILKTVPATHATAVTYLLPVWGVGWGLAAHEPVGVATVVGVAVVIAGLLLMNLQRPVPVAAVAVR